MLKLSIGVVLAVATAASAQDLVGVDFENTAAPLSPTNWNVMTASGSMPGLIDESGAATTVAINVSLGSSFATAVNSSTVPMHTNPLNAIDDYFFGTGSTVITLSGLVPGADYEVYVFGLRGFDMGNDVVISGGGAAISFNQDAPSGILFVNGSMGSSTQNLGDFAEVQSADAAGSITITVTDDPVAGAAGWTCAGVAIREAGGSTCYADCDNSGGLDFFDFLCFQNEFASGTAYADCDLSGSHDFFDFLCFQNEFANGCP